MRRYHNYIIGFGAVLLTALLVRCGGQNKPAVAGDKVREYANALYNRELYTAAVTEYQRYLDLYDVDDNERGNINFIIGNVYFDRLNDYENALARYMKVKYLYPDSPVMDEVNKRIVACLERLQRTADAKQALDEATAFDPAEVQQSRPGEVVAEVGGRKITSGDLAYRIGRLPEYVRSSLDTREAKLEFLQQIIAADLFYEAAKRQGLDRDKEVTAGFFEAKKSLMVQKYLEDQIASRIDISPDDVRLYYDAHKDRYTEKDDKGAVVRQIPFSEAAQQAAQDLAAEKQQRLYGELITRMIQTEDVKIYDDRIK
ncbi:hypothetical protein JXO52_04120 [bacterium]|nr:hypothetical protein [bacterium]